MRRFRLAPLAVVALVSSFAALACSSDVDTLEDKQGTDDFSSADATLLEFEFDGEVTGSAWNTKALINDQLLYTIGHLNGDRAVGRLDKVTLTNVKSEGSTTKYHAKLPVAWGSKTNLPKDYTFTLPKDASYQGQEAFTTKYKGTCAEFGAHDVDAGSMWYYFRPKQSACKIDAAESIVVKATAVKSVENTTGKYPEYDKVWEDGVLEVVAVFGKYEDGKTANSDAGISAYNRFISTFRSTYAKNGVTTKPEALAADPGVNAPDVELSATLANGRKIHATALLVDNVASAGATFNSRYAALSTEADVIMYNGHAGLGQNVRALASKGQWRKGKYVVVFMNGCDTFAYVDGSLAETRARINADDPTGTKYMEFVTNAMPAFFSSMPAASMSLINGLAKFDAPMTYEQILANLDDSQIATVTGEEDNAFKPGVSPNPNPQPTTWTGVDESFTLARGAEKRFEIGTVPAGKYRFDLTGTGDGDLYVRMGGGPVSTTQWTCRPYKGGSVESCELTATAAAPFSVMVRGYKDGSAVRLVGKKL